MNSLFPTDTHEQLIRKGIIIKAVSVWFITRLEYSRLIFNRFRSSWIHVHFLPFISFVYHGFWLQNRLQPHFNNCSRHCNGWWHVNAKTRQHRNPRYWHSFPTYPGLTTRNAKSIIQCISLFKFLYLLFCQYYWKLFIVEVKVLLTFPCQNYVCWWTSATHQSNSILGTAFFLRTIPAPHGQCQCPSIVYHTKSRH